MPQAGWTSCHFSTGCLTGMNRSADAPRAISRASWRLTLIIREGSRYIAGYIRISRMHRNRFWLFLVPAIIPQQGLWSISLKDFETPLERVPVGPELKELIRGNSFLSRYIEEWPHRNEHSIELQLPLIQFMVQDDFEILPILTGSMHEFIEGLKRSSTTTRSGS